MQVITFAFILGCCIIPAFALPSHLHQRDVPAALSSSSMSITGVSPSGSSEGLVGRKLNARVITVVQRDLNTLWENLNVFWDKLDAINFGRGLSQINEQLRCTILETGIKGDMRVLLAGLIILRGKGDVEEQIRSLNTKILHYRLPELLEQWNSLLGSLPRIHPGTSAELLQDCRKLSDKIKAQFYQNLHDLLVEEETIFHRDHPGQYEQQA